MFLHKLRSGFSKHFQHIHNVQQNFHHFVCTHAESSLVSLSKFGKELQGTITKGYKDGVALTIGLDSGSSVHLFKDNILLQGLKKLLGTDVLSISTTDSNFELDEIGKLNKNLGNLPLPKRGIYYYKNGILNNLSLALLAKEY